MLTWGERIRTLRRRMDLDQEAMGAEIGLSREWISKLERGKEEPSERVRLKVEKIEREQGIHISDPRFTSPRLKVGELPISATGEPPDRYGAVALLKPQQRAPSTRADCEIFVQHLLDAAEASGDPNAWPVILHRLKKQFSFDEWDDRPSPE